MFLFAVLLVSCIGLVSGASAEVLTRVRASGMGLISGGDRAAAFDQAKTAALREAAALVAGDVEVLTADGLPLGAGLRGDTPLEGVSPCVRV